GTTVTAPIVIQHGTYNEAGSSSWVPAVGEWTPATVPTRVTVEILRGEDVIVSATRTSIGESKATLDEVMPKAPTLETQAYYSSGASSKGIQVDIRGTYLQNAAEVRVTVHRGEFSDVVKTSKSS